MRKTFFLLITILVAIPANGVVDFQNIHCACVGAKTPSHKDAMEIRQAYPADDQVLRFIFKTQTYYIIVRHRRIFRVLSGWETGNSDEHLWAVLDKQGRLLEWLVFPGYQRIDMQEQQLSAVQKDGEPGTVYPEAMAMLRRNLDGQWPVFLKRARLAIYRVDTIGQATP